MSELDLGAIQARAANLANVRERGGGSFAGMLPTQLWRVAQSYAADVPALLDRIAELERENAAAMAIVRAVAELAPGDWPVRHLELSNDLVIQARALVAGETREEAGE